MKIAVVGSRTFNNYDLLCSYLNTIHLKEPISHIISGGAKGADKMGEKWANENGIETIIFIPDWEKYGRKAGFLRNKDIINEADKVVCFWDGFSNGTKNSIELAKRQGKKCLIVNF